MSPNRKLAAAIAAVCMVLSGLAAAVPTAAAAAAPLTAEIETRDQLIADQEALLNAYRCMFAVDVAAVPGGCANAAPALPAGEPGPPPPNPTKTDKDARDDLIAAQENLLNTYRCNHNIDTQLVPQGCPEATEDKEVVERPPTTIPPPEEEPTHVVSIPGNWAHLTLSQQLMLNPYQCTPTSSGGILFSSMDATCRSNSPSALTGEIVVVIGDDIPIVEIIPDNEADECPAGWMRGYDGQCEILGNDTPCPDWSWTWDGETGMCYPPESDEDDS